MPVRHLAAAALAAGLLPLLSPAARSAPPEAEKALVDLVAGPGEGLGEKAFTKGEYKPLRAAFAKYFEAKHGEALRANLGDDAKAVFDFLAENAEVRETLFTALDPTDDNLPAAMTVFRDLWKANPAAVKANDELAVAVAVVWDNPNAAYDYRGHQVRTKSTLPLTVTKVGPLDNFRYALDRQAKLKGPQQQLPWEFLVHAVNHRTPDDERDWAVANYLKKRTGVGAVYKEIVYDTEMLKTKSQVCKLNGHPYTLPSIKEHGGVCAMQADFAARVAKSLLVPAEYVGGEANSGVLHAWVMWAEVKAVNKDAVSFTLESFGRYNLDQYYVGTLRDPKTGQPMADRDMERRLTAVGTAPAHSRHADLLMRAYPVVSDAKGYTTKQQLAYLNKVLALYPMCEGAWRELARLHDDGKLTDSAEALRLANKALTTFAAFPDFSWRLLDDLLTPVKDKRDRAKTFVTVVQGYEKLRRPDLACDARLKLAEYLADAKDYVGAFKGLEFTVKSFPDEGRYVPQMVARMQEVAKDIKGGDGMMAKFYTELLPKVPTRRGDEVSSYCVKLHEQAAAYLKGANRPKEAALVEQSLARVKGGGK